MLPQGGPGAGGATAEAEMVPRQVWLFKLGCWIAIVTAAVHLVGHVWGRRRRQ